MELIPDRASYGPGQPVTIELSEPSAAASVATVFRLSEVVAEIELQAGSRELRLGEFEPGGYGVQLAGSATAFDVLDSVFQRPRYGFVVALTEDVDVTAVTRNFRRNHLTLAQLYDWGYRHSQLMPPTESYLDPLGQPRTLAVVNRMSAQLREVGTLPLGYSAVYAVGHDELPQWRDCLLLRPDGEPYRLGEDFLVLLDPGHPRWLDHYLQQLAAVVEQTAIVGFHLDQYGWPKFARRPDGSRVDLAASYVTMLEALRRRLPETPVIFNNVNDFPSYATASAPQDATYIEVWDPHSSLGDLGALASAARAHRPEHPPILSAYLSCYSGQEQRANAAAAFVMATAWSHGASHLLLGEDGHVLTAPYYPDNHELSASSRDLFAAWYDFQVRYGDLFYDPGQVDVTEFFTGGINNDLVFSGARFSTKAQAGAVWTRVVRTSHGLVVHLINLTDQPETVWDAGKNEPNILTGIGLTLAPVDADACLWFATVEEPQMRELVPTGVASSEQLDALSAGQSSVRFELPGFGAWAVVLVPMSELL